MKEYNWREEREKYRPEFQQKPQVQQEAAPQPPAPSGEPPRGSSAGKIIAIISVLVVIALVAVAAVLFVPKDGGKKKRSSKSSSSESSESAVAGDSARKLADAAEKNKSAVGVVVVTMEMRNGQKFQDGIGTAWAFAENKFATNAHVALGIKEAPDGLVQKLALTVMDKIAKAKQFKGFMEYREKIGQEEFKKQLLAEYTKIVPHVKGFSAAIYINGERSRSYPITHFQIHRDYGVDHENFVPDVAVLTIQGTHGKCFKIAEESSLHEIKAGDPVAFLGFPMENLAADNVNLANPIASMQTGNIVAVTDFEFKDAGKNGNQLIRHSLPATGGASGSPIFNADGEVIALLFAGNTITQGSGARGPSGVLINFAVRVDLLEGMSESIPIQEILPKIQ